MDGLLPGLVDKYGEDKPMTVDLKAKESPYTVFKEGQTGMDLTLSLLFNVVDVETAVELTLNDIDTIVDVSFEDFLFVPKLESMEFGEVDQDKSTIGDIDTEDFRGFLNIATAFIKPFINEILEEGIEIPQSFLNGTVSIKSATFEAHVDYLNIIMEPIFNWKINDL